MFVLVPLQNYKIQPIEFQNQPPASGSMGMLALFIWTPCTYRNIGSTICFFDTGCQKKTHIPNGLESLLEGGAMV